MIAAHPDDEDTELLTVLARGQGAEAAYLALTRGEGGQNLIGNELGPALGVLRTEELLAARALDGARQYFTPAYDFGFSKSLADAWRFWPADSVLKDVVRAIRRFQPQVIVAIFSGTPRDGHGQHQASGWAAREAFRAAADPTRFPELAAEGLAPWRTLKLYQSARFDGDSGVTTLDGGALDRAVGQSYLQIAMRGRSLHRSQDMGAAQRMGPSQVRIRLLEDLTGGGPDLFAGIDTTLGASLPAGAPATARAEAGRIAALLERVTPWSTDGLAGARAAWQALVGATGATPAAEDQATRLDAAAAAASGLLCDATAPQGDVVPGSRVPVALACWNTAAVPVGVAATVTLDGVPAAPVPPRRLEPGRVTVDTQIVSIPADAAPSQPYYLRSPLAGAMYSWPAEVPALWGRPTEPARLQARFAVTDGPTLYRDVEYRRVDQALGEVRRPIFVVPRVEVYLAPAAALWRAGVSQVLTVTVRHHSADSTRGSVALEVPEGWAAPPPQRLVLHGLTAEATLRFTLRPPADAAHRGYTVRAVARDESGRVYAAGTSRVEYGHIRPRQLVTASVASVALADLRLPGSRAIGYVRGAADRIPEALAALGVPVALLPADSLRGPVLARFGTVVIGPRAWETEPALASHNDQLLAWVREGGTLIVQYQQLQYLRGDYAPFPLSLAEQPGGSLPPRVVAPRVAEEDARVAVLVPSHRVFHSPNPIGSADWDGWVQERGLYFPRSWGREWTPLLEMADAGEPPQQGALLVATVGRGTYVYTGLSFFRQLPAAVPGAAKLFLNLLALGRRGG